MKPLYFYMEDILYKYNPWWDGEFEFPGIPRFDYIDQLFKQKNRKDIVLITGLRRVGKTTLIRQLIHKLLETTEPEKIFYVSLDNIALKERSIQEIVDIFRRINGLKHNEHAYLFLDEVHFKIDYELQLKNLYDLGHVKIYASGSSSLDLIMKSPYLTGRQRIIRMAPLNFSEYLNFTGQKISKADHHLLPAAAEDYIKTGGMPEYVLTKDLNILQSIVYSILFRDIAGRYEIRNRDSLFDILSLLAQSAGTPMSLRKISRVLGLPLDTINRTLELFKEANLVHLVEKEGKISERKASPRKIYLADTGLFSVLTENINLGALAENLVFLVLNKMGIVRYYRSSGREIDFIRKKHAWEVKYKSIIDEKDLGNIKNVKGLRSRVIITKDAAGKKQNVDLKPLWKFLQ